MCGAWQLVAVFCCYIYFVANLCLLCCFVIADCWFVHDFNCYSCFNCYAVGDAEQSSSPKPMPRKKQQPGQGRFLAVTKPVPLHFVLSVHECIYVCWMWMKLLTCLRCAWVDHSSLLFMHCSTVK